MSRLGRGSPIKSRYSHGKVPTIPPTLDSGTVTLTLVPSAVGVSAAFPTTGILDDFNRANEGPPLASPPWTYLRYNQSAQVVSNQAVVQNFANPGWATAFAADQEVYATLASAPTDIIRLWIRFQGQQGSGQESYIILVDPVNGWRIGYYLEATGFDWLIGYGGTLGFTTGHKIGASVIGNTINAWLNTGSGWVLQATATDSRLPGGGRIGLEPGAVQTFDDFGGGNAITGGPGEILGAVDSGTVALKLTPSVIETFQAVDGIAAALVLTAITSQEGFVFTEASTSVLSLTPNAVESAQFVDAATATVTFTPSGSDVYTAGAVFVDAATAAITFTPSTIEVFAGVDQTTATLSLTPSAIELAQFVDANTALVKFTPAAVEIVQYVDASTAVVVFTPSTIELVQLVDAATALVKFTPSIIELAQFVDANTAIVVLTPSGSDSYTTSTGDTAIIAVIFTPTVVEVLLGVDSGTYSFHLTPSSTEIQVGPATDTGTINLLFTPSSVESAGYVEQNTSTITFKPSSTEALGWQDTATSALNFTPAVIEGLGITDTAIGLLVLAPSGVEIEYFAYTDQNTALLRLIASAIEVFVPLVPPPEETDLIGILFRRFEIELEGTVYSIIATRRYAVKLEDLVYDASIPFRRWWTRFDPAN